jgi:zinc protease
MPTVPSVPESGPGALKGLCLLARYALVMLAGVFVLTSAARAATARDQPKAVTRATLDNGLRVVIVRNTLAPVVSVVVNYLAGSDEVPAGFPGMAHAQEHMMFRGGPGLTGDELAYLNAALGGMANARTQQSVTQYLNTVPAKDLDIALHIEALRMRGIGDKEEAWLKERGAIEQEVARDLSDPEYVLYTKLLKALFRDTPYAHDALGTRESFDKTTAAMLKAYYDRWYVPNNAILVIAGDVQPDKALAQVKALFGDIPGKKLPPRPAVHLQPVQRRTFTGTTDSANGLVIAAFRLPGYDSADYAAARLLAEVLDSERGDLYALKAEGKALGTDVGADFLPRAGLAYVAAEFPKGGDPHILLEQVKRVLADYADKGFPPDLVAAAKRRELLGLELEKSSIPKLAAAWSQALALEGRQSPQDDIEAMRRVTPEDLERLARSTLQLDQAVYGVLTPESSGKPVAAKGFGGAESFSSQHPGPVELPPWGRAALESVSVPASAVHPIDETLPNGLRLIIQPTTTSATVSLYGRVRSESDMETAPGKEGADQVLDRLFDYGTAKQGRLAFQRALDEIGANESAGGSFAVQALPDHFERAVALLAENELQPAFKVAPFAIAQRQIAAQVAGQLDSPGYLTQRALLRGLYPAGDPKLRQATPETVLGLKLDDVESYYHHVFRPDMTTIVVIGQVAPARAKAVISRYFGDWKAEGPRPDVDLPRVPLNSPAVTAIPDRSRVQDRVILAQTLGMSRFGPDYYPLELGNHVLGGGFYATRLYADLRKQNGLVYKVGTSIAAGRTRAVYVVEYACDPVNVTRARRIVEQDLGAMQSQPVSPHELQQAKALLMTETALGEDSVSAIAGGLLERATIGLPLNEPTLAAVRYLALGSKQVEEAYKRRLRLKDLVQVTQGPKPH